MSIHVSPGALRAFCADLDAKVRPLVASAAHVTALPLGAGAPFGADYPSFDVAQFALHHSIAAEALSDFLDGVLATLDALRLVAEQAAAAYEDADTRASVTARWVDIALTDRESQLPVLDLGNHGVLWPEAG